MQVFLPIERESGLSLVEVVVAMLLLTIALLGLALGFPPSRAAVHTGGQISVAVALAQETLEAMHNRQYTATIDEITAENFPDEDSVQDFPTFRRVVTIQDNVPIATCFPPGTPCSKTVTVSISTREATGEQHFVRLTMIFVRSGG